MNTFTYNLEMNLFLQHFRSAFINRFKRDLNIEIGDAIVKDDRDIKAEVVLEVLNSFIPQTHEKKYKSILSKGRKGEIVKLRRLYCYFLKKLGYNSLEIMKKCKFKNHSTVLFHLKKMIIELNIQKYDDITELYNEAKYLINKKLKEMNYAGIDTDDNPELLDVQSVTSAPLYIS